MEEDKSARGPQNTPFTRLLSMSPHFLLFLLPTRALLALVLPDGSSLSLQKEPVVAPQAGPGQPHRSAADTRRGPVSYFLSSSGGPGIRGDRAAVHVKISWQSPG